MFQHVMYKDIMASRRYLKYIYYDKFDVNDEKCLYCYDDNRNAIHMYLDKFANTSHINESIIAKVKSATSLSLENEIRIVNLFSKDNPSVRLSAYAGAILNTEKVISDIIKTDDIKRVLIELTGEINAVAIDGLLSLYATALFHLEGSKNTENTKLLQNYYSNLIENAFVFMKKGASTDFFMMPLSDLKVAIDKKDTNALMSSAKQFLDVYIKNNNSNNQNEVQ